MDDIIYLSNQYNPARVFRIPISYNIPWISNIINNSTIININPPPQFTNSLYILWNFLNIGMFAFVRVWSGIKSVIAPLNRLGGFSWYLTSWWATLVRILFIVCMAYSLNLLLTCEMFHLKHPKRSYINIFLSTIPSPIFLSFQIMIFEPNYWVVITWNHLISILLFCILEWHFVTFCFDWE